MTGKGNEPGPATLMQAHDLLTRARPSSSASALTWLRYYRRSAAVYAEVAEVDRGHHHEAMYWANRERAKATTLQAEMASSPEPPVVETVKEEVGSQSDTGVPVSEPTVHSES